MLFSTTGASWLVKRDAFCRVAATPFYQPMRFEKAVDTGTWNNARMMQFKTYNTNAELFAALLVENDYDLLAFIEAVGTITEGRGGDPFEKLKAHLGVSEE